MDGIGGVSPPVEITKDYGLIIEAIFWILLIYVFLKGIVFIINLIADALDDHNLKNISIKLDKIILLLNKNNADNNIINEINKLKNDINNNKKE